MSITTINSAWHAIAWAFQWSFITQAFAVHNYIVTSRKRTRRDRSQNNRCHSSVSARLSSLLYVLRLGELTIPLTATAWCDGLEKELVQTIYAAATSKMAAHAVLLRSHFYWKRCVRTIEQKWQKNWLHGHSPWREGGSCFHALLNSLRRFGWN